MSRSSVPPVGAGVTLGMGTAYQVLYNRAGRNIGAVRLLDPRCAEAWRSLVIGLYDLGESFDVFLSRELGR